MGFWIQVKDYARRIEAVDRDVAKLKETTATKKQLTDLKVDFRKLYVSNSNGDILVVYGLY